MPVPFAVWSLDGMLIKKSVAAHALVKKSIGSVVIKLPLKLMIVKKAANLARVHHWSQPPQPQPARTAQKQQPGRIEANTVGSAAQFDCSSN
jgi:hypothetical protein